MAALNVSGRRWTIGLSRTTMGFTGLVTVPYTFKITDATALPWQPDVSFGSPSPVNFTVVLGCTGPMQGASTQTNDPEGYFAEYPCEFSAASLSRRASFGI